jgi:putative hydrolase
VAAAMQQAMEALFKPLAPILSGMQMGLVMGFVATRALSQYDLCLPRPETGVVLVISRNADEVAGEIGVGRDEMRMWVAMHEIAHASAFAIPWVRRRLQSLLEAYLDSIHVDTTELQEHLGTIDLQDPGSLQRFAESAEGLLGRFISSDQPDVLESLQTFVSVLEGYAEHAVGVAATGLLRDGGRIAEGLRRRAEAGGEADRLLDSLLGLELTQARVGEAADFCAAVTARVGIAGLNRMWESIETLPTREELARPDAWLSRMASTPEGGMFRELG